MPLKLRSDVHEQLALDFNLSGLPATIVVAPNREVVASQQGYLGPAELDSFLRDCLARRPGTAADTRTARQPTGSPGQTPRSEGEPKNETELALSGYCAVSLICDRKLVPGHTDYTVRHEGRIYRFASLLMSDRFRAEPDRFRPVNDGAARSPSWTAASRSPATRGGACSTEVACSSAPPRKTGNFSSKTPSITRWPASPKMASACTACASRGSWSVATRAAKSREGRRYWFPDSDHRGASWTHCAKKRARNNLPESSQQGPSYAEGSRPCHWLTAGQVSRPEPSCY